MQKTHDYCFAVVREGSLSNHLYMKSACNAHFYSRKKKVEEEVEDVISIYNNFSDNEDMFQSNEEEDDDNGNTMDDDNIGIHNENIDNGECWTITSSLSSILPDS